MADPTEEPRRDDWEDDGGGPVKSFLEHLEDLRWMLIKSGAALLIAMIVCLYGTRQVVEILKWPLARAALIQVGHEQKVVVRFGTNEITTFETATNRFGTVDLGTNRVSVVQLEPVPVETSGGTNLL